MQIQINTANNVEGREALVGDLELTVRDGLSRFEERLTRVEVHVGDKDGPAHGGADKTCVIEARPSGLAPVTVTDEAGSISQAASRALGKLVTALDRTFGKLSDRKGH